MSIENTTRTKILTQRDREFVKRALGYFGIGAVKIDWSDSKEKYPDIWVNLSSTPVITVTREWEKQKPAERRKRIVHEMLHVKGLQHNDKIGYSTYPDKDSFSMKVYDDIMGGSRKFERRRFLK